MIDLPLGLKIFSTGKDLDLLYYIYKAEVVSHVHNVDKKIIANYFQSQPAIILKSNY